MAAWVLLWVFVPMMVLTAVHIHHEAVALSDSCHECVNHVPHGGHLSASGFSVDDCLICQTAALPYLMATTVAAVVVHSSRRCPTTRMADWFIASATMCPAEALPPFLEAPQAPEGDVQLKTENWELRVKPPKPPRGMSNRKVREYLFRFSFINVFWACPLSSHLSHLIVEQCETCEASINLFSMKTLQLLLLAFVCMGTWASPTRHTGMLKGHVSDESDGEALIGVSIYFPELKEGTITNAEGNYSIDNLPAVKTTVQVSYVGHQTIIREVDLRTTSHIDFTMKEANATLSEVVVTGLTGTELVSNSPSPVSIVSPRELMATASTNIIDALSKQPGVAQITTGGGISKPVIRGLGYNRVLVVSDGIRQEGQQWGDEHGIEIDAQRVHTVEILKGPATLVNGSDAMAGVLIFHDDPIMPRNTMEANVGTEYQTNNGLFGYTADFTGNRDGWVWNWRWSQKMAHDYKNRYDGYVANSRFQERALSGLLGTNRNWVSWH